MGNLPHISDLTSICGYADSVGEFGDEEHILRRHNSMMSVLSGLLAVGLVVGLSVGSALAVEPTDNTGAGQSATQALDSL